MPSPSSILLVTMYGELPKEYIMESHMFATDDGAVTLVLPMQDEEPISTTAVNINIERIFG